MRTKYFPLWAAFSVLAIVCISLTWWDADDAVHSTQVLIAVMYTMLAGCGWIACYAF